MRAILNVLHVRRIGTEASMLEARCKTYRSERTKYEILNNY